ncbi:MAG: DUF3786 domain-containing protein [Bacillota bacterium]
MPLYLDSYARTPIGNYAGALAKATLTFATADPARMAVLAGCSMAGGVVPGVASRTILLPCLGHLFEVEHPAGHVHFAGSALEPNGTLLIVILNHLARADGTPLDGRPISYRELPGGEVFWRAFVRYSSEPLAGHFGARAARLPVAARLLGGESIQTKADFSVRLPFFPRLPVIVQVSAADDELPGAANILFDASAPHYVHTGDAAAVGSYVGHLLAAVERGADSAGLADHGVV